MIAKKIINGLLIIHMILILMNFGGADEKRSSERSIYYFYSDECKDCILVNPQIKEFAEQNKEKLELKNVHKEENREELERIYSKDGVEYIILPSIVEIRQNVVKIYKGYKEVSNFLLKEKSND